MSENKSDKILNEIIKETFSNWGPGTLHQASTQNFADTGNVSGSLLIAIKVIASKYAEKRLQMIVNDQT